MPDIKIDRDHQLGREEAHRRLVDLEPKLKDKYGVRLAWDGDHARVTGTGVSGTIRIAESHLAVDIKLGLLLTPMATRIRASLERQIDRALS